MVRQSSPVIDQKTAKKSEVRVRIAPSPTGIPHIGNTRTALYNYLFAKHNSGKFILRIEDTDRVRFVPESEKAILEILEWLGLEWDETYVQSERLNIYKDHVQQLVQRKLAYMDEGAIRFKMPKTGITEWEDLIGSKKIKFENKTQEDFIILKSDGYPTYNFANVIDDHLMNISHVIRGEEFISSTPKHLQLYKAFGWEHPYFAHLPVILGPDHQKLSKRHGAKSALEYRKEGYLKEALLNYIVLLGWNPGDDREIMTLSEMIDLFELKDVNTASPVFDNKKLLWMNGEYMRKSQISNLKSQIFELLPGLKVHEELIDKLLPLAQARMTTLTDFYTLANPLLENKKIKLSSQEQEIMTFLRNEFTYIENWNKDAIFDVLKKTMEKFEIRMPVLYKVLTGEERGLPLAESLEILGKENILDRLKKENA